MLGLVTAQPMSERPEVQRGPLPAKCLQEFTDGYMTLGPVPQRQVGVDKVPVPSSFLLLGDVPSVLKIPNDSTNGSLADAYGLRHLNRRQLRVARDKTQH